jgi:anti-sigma regulatory factor (Ser/Thr protein kinase)
MTADSFTKSLPLCGLQVYGAPVSPASCSFPADAASVPSARHFVRATLEQLDASAAWDTLSMLLSELATNAVLHARTEFHVEIIRAADRVRVSVTDLSPVIPRQRDYAADSTTGRGMRLVDSLAVAWGVERGTDRKTVWFEVLAAGDDGRLVEPWESATDVDVLLAAFDDSSAAGDQVPTAHPRAASASASHRGVCRGPARSWRRARDRATPSAAARFGGHLA